MFTLPNMSKRWKAALVALLLSLLAMGSRPAQAQEWAAARPQVVIEASQVDTPPDWVRVPGIFVEVHGEGSQRALLTRVARHAAEALPELADRLGVPIGGTIRVYIPSSDAQFERIQPGNAPRWAGGTAYPGLGVIFLKSGRASGPGARPITRVLEHELVHILLGRAFAPHDPPQWLQEGMAQVMANELGPDATTTLARGMASPRGLMSFDGLDRGFPADAGRARLAYAQSAHFLGWMRGTYGDASLRVLVRELARGSSTGASVRRATGSSLEAVEGSWRDTLAPPGGIPLWLSVVGSADAWWALTGAIGLAAVVVARRRFRRRLDRLREEEEAARKMEEQWVNRLIAGDWGHPSDSGPH